MSTGMVTEMATPIWLSAAMMPSASTSTWAAVAMARP